MNKRHAMRFETAFPVILTSDTFGEFNVMARNISSGGILLEMTDPLPLGTPVKVHFAMPGALRRLSDADACLASPLPRIIAYGEVKNHYFLNFADAAGARSLSAMAVRFKGFEREGAERLGASLAELHTLH